MDRYFLSIIASVFCTFAFSQYKHEIGLQTDNDSYLAGGSDRYYTNGISLYYQKALNTKLEKKSDIKKIIFGIELTQKMYNPKSGYVRSPKDIDRPFAGYTYIASHLNLLYKNETNVSLSVQLGIIGKASGTEAAQNLIHRVLSMYEPLGWQYQINNQFIFNVSAEYNKLLFRRSFLDLIFNSIVTLGNGNIGADIGSIIRIGKFNPLFNSMATKSLIGSDKEVVSAPYELYFFYKPKTSYKVYDATVQGNMFNRASDTKQVSALPEHFVLSHQLGVEYGTKHFVVGVAITIQTKDVKSMVASQHQWGSIKVSYLF